MAAWPLLVTAGQYWLEAMPSLDCGQGLGEALGHCPRALLLAVLVSFMKLEPEDHTDARHMLGSLGIFGEAKVPLSWLTML